MRNTTKKAIGVLLAVCLTLSLAPVLGTQAQAAYTPKYTNYANALYDLGLFRGTGTDASGKPNFELGRSANRAEALVMLIRLLGEDKAALSYTGTQPFTDIPSGNWAYKYVGYAYSKGYTNGTGKDKFSPGTAANAKMYVTFVLRALLYSEARGDFTYNTSLDTAAELRIIPKGAYSTGTFYRDDCAYVSYMALMQILNTQNDNYELLAEALRDKGVITQAQLDAQGLAYGMWIGGNMSDAGSDKVDVDYRASAPATLKVDIYSNGGSAPVASKTVQAAATGEDGATVTVPFDSGLPASFTVKSTIMNSYGILIFENADEGSFEGSGKLVPPAPAPSPSSAPTAARKVVTASTPAEIKANIKDNTEIKLQAKTYDFGYEGLIVDKVNNFRITGVTGSKIIIDTGAEVVMRIYESTDVVISGVSIGHSPDQLSCEEGVLQLGGCKNVSVNSCDIYGCGICGFDITNCSGVFFSGTVIRDCSRCIGSPCNSSLTMSGCTFKNDGYNWKQFSLSQPSITVVSEPDYYEAYATTPMLYLTNCTFTGNKCPVFAAYEDYSGNTAAETYTAAGGAHVVVNGCTFTGNGWQ